MSRRFIFITLFTAFVLILSLLFFRKSGTIADGTLFAVRTIAESAPVSSGISSLNNGDSVSEIIKVKPNDLSGNYRVITGSFYSSISPVVSYDRTSLLFSARQSEESGWQIYKMGSNLRRAIPLSDPDLDCFDPFFLPSQMIGFSCTWEKGPYGTGSRLYIHDLNSSITTPVTFHPHSDYGASLLHDGRILYTSKRIYPDKSPAQLKAIRPDGSANMTFFEPENSESIWGKAQESSDRRLFYMIDNQEGGGAKELLSIPYTNPFAEPDVEYQSPGEILHSFAPFKDHSIVISTRSGGIEPHRLIRYSRLDGESEVLLQSNEYHYTNPVLAGSVDDLPKRLPSSLNPAKKYGIAVIVDPDQSYRYLTDGEEASFMIHAKTAGGREHLIEPANDGSLYLKLDAGRPVLLTKTDQEGNTIKGSAEWLWVMPGERTGFTGWDRTRFISPANRVPLAINDPAVDLTEGLDPLFVSEQGSNQTDESGYAN